MTPSTVTNIMSLPVEILLIIASFIPLQEYLMLLKTSRRMHEVLAGGLFPHAFKRKLWAKVGRAIVIPVRLGDSTALRPILHYVSREDSEWLSCEIPHELNNAVWLGRFSTVSLMVEYGASLSPDSPMYHKNLWTGMMCSSNLFKMLKLLIPLGLGVNYLPAKDDNYQIHLATVYGDRQFLKALLFVGADFSLPGPYEQTAHEIAREYARVY
ncbi:uncharacterized protein N7503_004023 [Penicillium pulvis]|uniref:uncharacterized protein n=1 Tax=Penicillium pulvis TaxID=1562058 RepID=UPI0025471088|nr:uncharacterized protein N7503_004023 [Penicillium pulvis]KAJ5806421.1 hypothetical protein N7503_004023 [Penicillium pulvis]